jgi:hypothetical protein
MGSAQAEFQEKEKGLTGAGKLADLVIVSEDLFKMNPVKIRDARGVMTICAGKLFGIRRRTRGRRIWNGEEAGRKPCGEVARASAIDRKVGRHGAGRSPALRTRARCIVPLR